MQTDRTLDLLRSSENNSLTELAAITSQTNKHQNHKTLFNQHKIKKAASKPAVVTPGQ
jgi:fibronectin type 3 domain-containing protein